MPELSSDKLALWEEHRFDVYFKGDDWRGSEKGRALEATLAPVGVTVVYFPYTMTTSSTILRKALAAITADRPAAQVHALSS